jgi:hypothetical protein
VRTIFVLATILGLSGGAAAQTFSCPSGTEDMLNYFVMAYPNRVDSYMGPGNANPIYSSINPELQSGFAAQGYFVWTKSLSGYPWDVKTFDANFVYDRSTELTWVDPSSFKRFNTDLPMSQRCVPTLRAGHNIHINPAQSAFTFYNSCTAQQTSNLGYVVNSITKPTLVNTGGSLGQVKTRLFKYQYGCNSSYSSCTDMEVFSLGYQIGLYDWKHYVAQSGSWVMKQESIINNFSLGQTTPMFMCTNTYQ